MPPIPLAYSHRFDGDSIVVGSLDVGNALSVAGAPVNRSYWIDQEFPSTTVDTMAMELATVSIGGGTGNVIATFFKPSDAMTVSKFTTCTGGAGATSQTLSRAGLARVDSYGATLTEQSWLTNPAVVVTPLAETASNLTLWATATTIYTNSAFSNARGLAASVLLDPSQWYAFLSIQVAATAGQMRGYSGVVAQALGSLPLRSAVLAAQSDLPTTQFTLTSLSSIRGWGRFHQ